MKYFCFLIILIYSIGDASCQEKDLLIKNFYPYRNEIGINFTNVLGNVLSLNPNNTGSPYGLTFRRHMGKSSFRSAFNIDVANKEEDDFSNGSFLRRKIDILKTNFRIGIERHIVLSSRVLFSYGMDILGSFGRENSKISDFNLGGKSFESNQITYGGGLGPMLRLEYKISDRLYISSESSLYGYYSRTTEKLTLNGVASEEPERKNSSLKLELPQSLFFNFSF